MTDTPALEILEAKTKTAGLGDFARKALITGAALGGGIGGHQLVDSRHPAISVVPSAMSGRSDVLVGGHPSDYRGYQHGAAEEIAGNMRDNQSALSLLGGVGAGVGEISPKTSSVCAGSCARLKSRPKPRCRHG